MLHTNVGQDSHCSLRKKAESVKMLTHDGRRTTTDKKIAIDYLSDSDSQPQNFCYMYINRYDMNCTT